MVLLNLLFTFTNCHVLLRTVFDRPHFISNRLAVGTVLVMHPTSDYCPNQTLMIVYGLRRRIKKPSIIGIGPMSINDHKTLLKIMARVQNGMKTYNDLSDLAIDAEDEAVAEYAYSLLQHVIPTDSKESEGSLISKGSKLEDRTRHMPNHPAVKQAELIKKIVKDCTVAIARERASYKN